MNNLINNSKLFLKKNSSTILTCIGAIGVAATAIVSAKDTIKAVEMLKKKEEPDVKLSKKEVIKTVAPAYIPTVIVGLSTMVCIFGANTLNKRTQASLVSAYALLDQSYKDYQTKVKEVCGEEKSNEVKESLAKLYYNDSGEYIKDEGKQLFFDFHGLQFFNATMEDVLRAEQSVNQLLQKNNRAGLNSFYEMIGVECADIDYEVGWSYNTVRDCGYDHIVFEHEKIKNDDGSEFIAITMVTEPVIDFMWF